MQNELEQDRAVMDEQTLPLPTLSFLLVSYGNDFQKLKAVKKMQNNNFTKRLEEREIGFHFSNVI